MQERHPLGKASFSTYLQTTNVGGGALLAHPKERSLARSADPRGYARCDTLLVPMAMLRAVCRPPSGPDWFPSGERF